MKTFAAFMVGFLTITTLAVPVVHASGQATMGLSPASAAVATGDLISLTITVSANGESIDTARAHVSFPASMLQVVSFDLGTLFPSEAPESIIDNTSGWLSEGGFKFGAPVTTGGTFGTITFKAIANGNASVQVLSDSKLISNGVEKINTAALGKATLSISGSGSTTITTPAPTTTSTSTPEEQALVYFGAFAGRMPSSDADWDANHCIAYDTCYPGTQDLAKEQQALVLYTTKYGSLPVDSIGWNAIHAIAYTNVFINWDATTTPPPTTTTTDTTTITTDTTTTSSSSTPEQRALVYFGAFAGRMPSSSADWDADHCIAYDTCKPSVQDISKEQQALVLYTTKYGSLPIDSIGWNAIHAIAYTNVFINWDANNTTSPTTTTDTTTTSTTSEVTTTELTPEQQAIGTFGRITGRSPSTDADWLAVDYIVHGYTPSQQDLDKESQALTLFTQVFGYLPSSDSDWNIMSAIAYSGAIL